MKKSDSLPVQPVRETKPVTPSAAIPEFKRFKANREPVEHNQINTWPKDKDSQQFFNARPGTSSDRDSEEGKYTPTEKPW